MDRRTFLHGMAGGLLAAPLAAEAQQRVGLGAYLTMSRSRTCGGRIDSEA